MFGFGFGFGRGAPPPPAVVASPAFPSTGLVAYWGFDDSLTDSVGSKVLTASGGNSYVTGKLGTKGLQLTDGNSASVTTNDFNFIANPMTVSFWAKQPSGGSVEIHYYTGDVAFKIADIRTEVDAVWDSAGSGSTILDAFTTSDDTWNFYCFRFDGSGVALNVNGRTKVTDVATTLGDYTGGSLQLIASGGSCVFDGLAVWNVALNDSQVSNVYNGGSGNSPA